ncbi:MAG: 16S rRNA (cytosine(1402)-N(4))-methyltransferase RsmH [Deltaproteobacteria bacterium]|nr:16S rRNA (cytosine(1402)-N(4))-methyltransferase RsmH [Deltaproteobacteria bacterium]
MTREVLDALAPRSGGVYVDATLGGGGHAEAILASSRPAGRVVGIDRDAGARDAARVRLAPWGDRAEIVPGRFGDVRAVLSALHIERVDGLVADLGVSSPQLDDPSRGMSFRASGPLDMRMDPTQGETARDLVARLPESELADVLYQLGEERRSRAIARRLKRALADGKLETTADARRACVAVLGDRGRIDPATRTFQALRIAVNDELGELSRLLDALPDVLADRAVAVVLTFHSLEDRLVKRAFRGDERLEPLYKKPLVAGDDEVAVNPRARSAKLRAARRLPRETDAGERE